jgi:ABC-type transport system involved in cytochrome c biogenesis permease component
LLKLIVILLLVNIGVSAVGTLLGSIVMSIKSRSSVLSILVMALIMPMMIPAISGLLMVLGAGADGGMFSAGQSFNETAGMMAAYDAIFVTVCWLVFGFTVG